MAVTHIVHFQKGEGMYKLVHGLVHSFSLDGETDVESGIKLCEIRGHNLCYKSHRLILDRIRLIY